MAEPYKKRLLTAIKEEYQKLGIDEGQIDSYIQILARKPESELENDLRQLRSPNEPGLSYSTFLGDVAAVPGNLWKTFGEANARAEAARQARVSAPPPTYTPPPKGVKPASSLGGDILGGLGQLAGGVGGLFKGNGGAPSPAPNGDAQIYQSALGMQDLPTAFPKPPAPSRIPPMYRRFISDADAAYFDGVLNNENASQAEMAIAKMILEDARAQANKEATGADNSLGYAQLAESKRQHEEQIAFQREQEAERRREFELRAAFEKEQERNRLEDALAKLGMNAQQMQMGAASDLLNTRMRMSPYTLPTGTRTVPGFEQGGIFNQLGLSEVPVTTLDTSQMQGMSQSAGNSIVDAFMNFLRTQRGAA